VLVREGPLAGFRGQVTELREPARLQSVLSEEPGPLPL